MQQPLLLDTVSPREVLLLPAAAPHGSSFFSSARHKRAQATTRQGDAQTRASFAAARSPLAKGIGDFYDVNPRAPACLWQQQARRASQVLLA